MRACGFDRRSSVVIDSDWDRSQQWNFYANFVVYFPLILENVKWVFVFHCEWKKVCRGKCGKFKWFFSCSSTSFLKLMKLSGIVHAWKHFFIAFCKLLIFCALLQEYFNFRWASKKFEILIQFHPHGNSSMSRPCRFISSKCLPFTYIFTFETREKSLT